MRLFLFIQTPETKTKEKTFDGLNSVNFNSIAWLAGLLLIEPGKAYSFNPSFTRSHCFSPLLFCSSNLTYLPGSYINQSPLQLDT